MREREPASLGPGLVEDRRLERGMGRRDVVDHVVEDHAKSARVRQRDQLTQLCLNSEAWLDCAVVRGVVAVMGWAGEDRGEPEAGRTEVDDVIEPLDDAAQGPAVEPTGGRRPVEGSAPGGREAVDEDLVDDRLAKPLWDLLVVHVDGLRARPAHGPERLAVEREHRRIEVRHPRRPLTGDHAGDLGCPDRTRRML